MEKRYEGSNILLWESRTYSKSSQIFIAFSLTFIVDLTFGTVLNIRE